MFYYSYVGECSCLDACPSAWVTCLDVWKEKRLYIRGRQNKWTPKDVYILFPETYQYIILYDTREFAGVIKLRLLR